MNIEKILLTHVRVPLVEPFRISNGSIDEKDGIIVSVFAEGLVGHGEASPMSGSFYSQDTPESTWDDLTRVLVPAVRAADVFTIDAVNSLLDRTSGNPFAKAGIETAFWDLESQRKGMPIYTRLGGRRHAVECGLAVGIYPEINSLIASIEQYLGEGYKRLKIKVQPGWDIDPLTEIRKRFGDIPLMVDANCAYTRDDFEHLKEFDAFGLMMIEQPLPKGDLEGHAALQARLRTPVCLDESATDVRTVERAIRLKSCQIINIKIQRVGGLKNALAIHDVCAAAGIPVWGGTMPELGIGGVQTVHLSTLDNFTYPTDVQSSRRWFIDDIVEPLIEARKGVIEIPPGTGNCYTLNTAVVKRFTVRMTEM